MENELVFLKLYVRPSELCVFGNDEDVPILQGRPRGDCDRGDKRKCTVQFSLVSELHRQMAISVPSLLLERHHVARCLPRTERDDDEGVQNEVNNLHRGSPYS